MKIVEIKFVIAKVDENFNNRTILYEFQHIIFLIHTKTLLHTKQWIKNAIRILKFK